MFSNNPVTPAVYWLYRLFWTGLDWLYPPNCFGCDMIGVRWCQSCQDRLKRISSPICPCCGYPNDTENLCQTCDRRPPVYDGLRSLTAFDGSLKTAFHRLKYRGDIGLGEALSQPLVGLFNDLDWKVDLVTPIPSGGERLKKRGYNQAALIALPFALATGIRYRPKYLIRLRETPTQVGLSAKDRRENMANAFGSIHTGVFDKSVLIIDDVTTTGATLDVAASALRKVGAKRVYCLTVARSLARRSEIAQ
jgi:ComF family protein